MPQHEKEMAQTGLLERFRKSWFPPAAVVGAFSAFVAAAFRVRPSPKAPGRSSASPRVPGPSVLPVLSPSPAGPLEREYALSLFLGGSTSAHPFLRSLTGVAIGAGDRIYALGDGEIRIFESKGELVGTWKAPENAACLTVTADGVVYIGAADRVEIYDVGGIRRAGFTAGEKGRPATVTAIKVVQKEILVADAAARFIRRYDSSGNQSGTIGTNNKTGGFMLPNRWLDFDVDTKGIVHATDTGRHQVTAWTLGGSPVGAFGKFGMSRFEDFVGCCNPVNLAVTPDDKIVTAEKMVARVKVYETDGKLLALIGPEHFEPNCTHIYLAVDSKGRILAADPVRRAIRVFSRVVKVAAEDFSGRSLNANE